MNTDSISTNKPEPMPTFSEGQKIAGCYVLKKKLDGSDVEVVWLAQDEVLGKDVTLHFAPGAVLRDPRASAELRSEVKRNRQLIHPNIVRIYDFLDDGTCAAISMDKYEGESLADLLRQRGAFRPAEVISFLKDIAETLDDANRVQLIHRDLSPDNLFVRPGGGIVIKGFGVSRVIRDALERAGIADGDAAHLAYMSPQLIDGERPSPADDVYGFGVLVFELLTGAPPFVGENLVVQIRKSSPTPLSEALVAAGVMEPVPGSWEETVAACLSKTPDQRPRNCAEVVSRLTQDSPAQAAATTAVPAKAAAPTAVERSAEVSKPSEVSKQPESKPAPRKSVEPAKESPIKESAAEPADGTPPQPPASKKGRAPEKRPLPENFPDLDRPKSKLPLIGLGIAAVALGFAVVSKFMGDFEEPFDPEIDTIVPESPAASKPDGDPIAKADPSGTDTDANGRPRGSSGSDGDPDLAIPKAGVVAANPGGSKPPVVPAPEAVAASTGGSAKPKLIGAPVEPATPAVPPKTIAATPPEPKPDEPALTDPTPVAPKPAPPKSSGTQAANPPAEPPKAVKSGVVMQLPPLPAPPPKLVIPKDATEEQIDQIIVERTAAYDKLKALSAAFAVANEENTALRTARKGEVDAIVKEVSDKRKTLSPIIRQAATVEADRKKLEDAKAKSEAAAAEAAKAAAAAAKEHDEFVVSATEKLAAKEKAEAELQEADAKLAAVKKTQDEIDGAIAKGGSDLKELEAVLRRADDDQKALKAAYDVARSAAAARIAAANKAKIAAIEGEAKLIEAQRARYAAALVALKDLPEMAESAKKMEAKISDADAQIAELKKQIREIDKSGKMPEPGKGSKKPPLPEAAPKKNDAASASPPVPVEAANPPAATPNGNSLGMEFVEVGDVQMARNVTTRAQFEVFSKAVGLKPERWRNPGFEQGENHPVVNVSWREADEFCKWLTATERKTGQLKAGEEYRLPTDLEWSKAVGLPEESGATPEERDMRIENIYPWGTQWPPPAGSGNFAGEETETELPIRGYNDGFANTSPVGSFKPNALGLHDMSGNVWQWVQDGWDSKGSEKTLRGGSWYNGAIPMSLLSSCRIKSSPDTIHDTYGFRIVKAKVVGKRKK